MTELNKSEKYLYEAFVRLSRTGYKDEEPRGRYEDGSPAHSFSIRGSVSEVYDINAGEFPITETRPIHITKSIDEMFVIYQDQLNTREGFENRNIFWWENWFDEKGTIGKAYPYNLESHRFNEMRRSVVKVPIIKLDNSKFEPIEIKQLNPIKNSLDGVVYKSNYQEYGEYIITDSFIVNDRGILEVQFLNNGYITTVRKDSLDRGQHPKNNFTKTLLNVGYVGDFHKVNNIKKEHVHILKKMWNSLMRRCYDGTRVEYKDVFVDNRWHSFENFLTDVRQLPQYHLAKEDNFKGWHIDKDYYGSNAYSNKTCVFLKTADNLIYRRSQSKPLIVNNDIFLTHTEVASLYNVSKSTVARAVKNGELNTYHGTVKVIELDNSEEFNYRYELSRNQINELLNGLKNNPYSKRHIVSFFHWANIDKKQLVECAYETQWSISKVGEERFLDVTLIQRSSDALVAGTGINQMQYVAFQMAVAKHLGIKPGLFEHSRKNWHIYDRHLPQLEETINRLQQLQQRDTQSRPKLVLNVPDGTNFYDIKSSDFELVDYNPIRPQLKFELAI